MAAEVFTPDVVDATPTPTPDVAEATPTTPETWTTELEGSKKSEPLTEDEVKKNSEITESSVQILMQIKELEDIIQDIQNSPEVDDYKAVIHEYNSLKDKIWIKMQEDQNFQKAMEEIWKHVDDSNKSLDEREEPDAWEYAVNIVKDPASQQQITNIIKVYRDWYDSLNSDQKDALDKNLKLFKDDITNIFKHLIEKKAA